MNTTIAEVTVEEKQRMVAAELAADLRLLAEIVENAPLFAAAGSYGCPVRLVLDSWSHDAATMAALRREIGGRFEKVPVGDYIVLRRKLGNGRVWIDLNAQRDKVCERVVVKTTTIPEEVIPEHVVPEQVLPERVVEEVEWRCGSILEAEGSES